MIRHGRIAAAGTLAFALIAAPLPAVAHVAIEGADDFTAGVLHPFFVLAHLLAIIGLGLLLAQQGLSHIKAAVPAFTATLIAGFLWPAFGIAALIPTSGMLLGTALVIGLLVAAARPVPRWAPAVLAALAGFAVGIDSVPESGTLWTTVLALTGTGLSVCLLLVNVLALASYARRPWQAIGLRVLGSWIGACSLMVSALALR
jgi:hydrogenase/urease accessory protein HupE